MKPFRINGESLEAHRLALEALLSTASLVRRVALDRDDVGALVAFGVARGEKTERTARNLGADVFVVPMLDLGGGLLAWLGYREEWSSEAAGRSTVFTFRSSGATIHFGFEGVEPKPQMFRAEWAGLVRVDKGYGFQGGDAGHPHWQFDAIESLAAAGTADEAEVIAGLIRADKPEPEVRDFGVPAAAVPEVRTVASSRALASIHFASAAAWWRTSPADTHAHYPANVQQIQRWLARTLSYVAVELRRV